MKPQRRTHRAHLGRFQPDLEEALVAEVARIRGGEPLEPIELLVGSNLLGIHLRRMLARRLGAIAGIRPQTFLDLAHRRAGNALIAAGRRPLPRGGDELLIEPVIDALPGGGPFDAIRDTRGLRVSLLATIQDLKEAGWTPDRLAAAAEGARGSESGPARRPAQLAKILAAYERALAERGLHDRSDLLARAAEGDGSIRGGVAPSGGMGADSTRGSRAGESAPDCVVPLLAYGFYDLNELQWRLLRAMARDGETVLFVPWADERAFAFGRALIARLEAEGFEIARARNGGAAAEPAASGERPDAAPQREPAWDPIDPSAFPSAPDADGRLERRIRFLSAPGEARECDEIARQVQEWAAEGIGFHDMAVLARTSGPLLGEISRALGRARVPHVIEGGAPLARERSARAALRLLDLMERDWGRGEVLAFLAVADLDPRLLPACGPAVMPSAWERISAKAGIVGGWRDWTERLRRFIGDARDRAGFTESARAAAGDDDPSPDRAQAIEAARADLDAARALQRVLQELHRNLEPWPESGSWRSCVERFTGALVAIQAPSPALQDVCEALRPLRALDAVGPCRSADRFADAVRGTLARATLRQAGFQRDGLLLADVVAARGLGFRAVAIAGLSEGAFPASGREDPLLTDREREGLAATVAAPAPLPRKGDRIDEEWLLFRLAIGSASERLLLTWSRLSPGRDDPRPPSPFVLAAGEACDVPETALVGESRSPLVRTVPRLPAIPAGARSALDRPGWLAARASALARRLRAGAAARRFQAAADELLRELPFFAAGLVSERERWSGRRFGPYDGALGPEAAERAYAIFAPGTLSASRVEGYAVCPLRTFFRSVLGLEPCLEPEEVDTIEARDRGMLAHAILADFLRQQAANAEGRARLDRVDPETLRRQLLDVAQTRFEKADRHLLVGYPALWVAARERLIHLLERWLEREIEAAASDDCRPALFEVSFGGPGDEASSVRVALPRAGEVSFRGRIDRIDRDASGATTRIIDYKSGSAMKAPLPSMIANGTCVQLPIYRLAGTALAPGAAGGATTALFRFLTAGDDAVLTETEWEEQKESFLQALDTYLASARAGDFTPDPRKGTNCQFCDFGDPCGPSRDRRFERKAGDPAVAARLALRSS